MRFKIHSTIKKKVESKAAKAEKEKAQRLAKVAGQKGGESAKPAKALGKKSAVAKKRAISIKDKDKPKKSKSVSGVTVKPDAASEGNAAAKVAAAKKAKKVTFDKSHRQEEWQE